jgi:hypothetical protein
LNAIQALSQLSYAPRDPAGNAKRTFPSGTAKNSRGYIECQEIGASGTSFGRYFARGRMTVLTVHKWRRSFVHMHFALAPRTIFTAAVRRRRSTRFPLGSAVVVRPSLLIDAYSHA